MLLGPSGQERTTGYDKGQGEYAVPISAPELAPGMATAVRNPPQSDALGPLKLTERTHRGTVGTIQAGRTDPGYH